MELITYKTLFDEDRANAIVDLLKANGVEYLFTRDRESLDSLYGDNQFKIQYFIKIRPQDFPKVDHLILKQSSIHLEEVDADHYLFSFTNNELYDILAKPDEWNEFDYVLAQKILRDRGEEVDPETIAKLKGARIQELAKPDEGNRAWIYVGYAFAFLGGLLGIFIGWHLSTFKKTLPNGERVYGHTEQDRLHGKRMLVIGLIMFAFWLSMRILVREN